MELVHFEVYAWCKVNVLPDLIRPIIDLFPRLYNDDFDNIVNIANDACKFYLEELESTIISIYTDMSASVCRYACYRVDEILHYEILITFSRCASRYINNFDVPIYYNLRNYIVTKCINNKIRLTISYKRTI